MKNYEDKFDCGSDHEILIDKFRLKLKKVGKTTRLFRYYLNQIPYDYTVEVSLLQVESYWLSGVHFVPGIVSSDTICSFYWGRGRLDAERSHLFSLEPELGSTVTVHHVSESTLSSFRPV